MGIIALILLIIGYSRQDKCGVRLKFLNECISCSSSFYNEKLFEHQQSNFNEEDCLPRIQTFIELKLVVDLDGGNCE